MVEMLKDLFFYLKKRKKYWMIPILSLFFVFGLLIVLSHGSALSPFIYSFF
ncbi:MAG: DUF5989 family protein [Bdellovibrionota bacterium]|nr:DUF5989 family protein [Bdellovibrionota bacterium]